MNSKRQFFACVMAGLMATANLMAQEENVAQKDSVPPTKEVKNRNVMLNASTDNQPREISIGLPASLGMAIFEDGLPVSHHLWPCLPFASWKGGTGVGFLSVMSLGESALRNGTVGYIVDSYAKRGSDTFSGAVDYTLNHFGMQRIDMTIMGPIAKGWQYSLNTYQNFDPGTNKLGYAALQDRSQIYKGGLTKVWDEGWGKFSIFYKYSKDKSGYDTYAPFYYEGDGSVSAYNGFDMGHDSYMPSDGYMMHMDPITGDTISTSLQDGVTRDRAHEVNVLFDYRFKNGNLLTISSKYKNGKVTMNNIYPVGITEVTAADGYVYEDGTSFAGPLQSRLAMHMQGFERSWLTNAQLTGKTDNHSWRLGLDERLNHAGVQTGSSFFAHEVAADPERLLLTDANGNAQRFWLMNTGAEYYDGHENKLAIFLSDDWQASERLWLSAGLRLEYQHQSIDCAVNEDGKTNNDRTLGFYLNNGTASITHVTKDWLNPSANVNLRYTLLRGFGLMGEYVFNRQRPALNTWTSDTAPVLDPVDVHLVRAGLFFNRKWIQLVSQFSYITQTNNNGTTQFTQTSTNETINETVNYNIATMGWTTDAVITPFKGFSFHGLLTLQKPLYKDYVVQPTFSNGESLTYDFSDKIVPGISRMIIELDPSYSFGPWRVWASFRYQSKQYINKTNSLHFNGRWETFGGVDYRLNKYVAFSAKVINFLNQKGVSGSISSADLIEDASDYKHYLMSGNYIRPFTFELTTHINF